jgi:hypothetical protein
MVEPPNIELEVLLNLQYLIQKYQIEHKYIPTILNYFYEHNLLSEDFLI